MPFKRIILFLGVAAVCFGGSFSDDESVQGIAGKELVESSFTVAIRSFQQNVTVDATLEQVFNYLSNPAHVSLPTTSVEQEAEITVGDKSTPLGESIRFTAWKLFYKFTGRMILVKNDQENTWFLWHSPEIFQFRKWRFEPVGDKVRIRIDSGLQVPSRGFLSHIESITRLFIDKGYKDMDLQLARMQAHFNPGLDPQEVVSKGLRGEIFDTIYPAHEVSVWIDAGMEESVAWLKKSGAQFLQLVRSNDGCLYSFPEDKPVFHCAAYSEHGHSRHPLDTFTLISSEEKLYSQRVYLVSPEQLGFMEIKLKPKANGTLLQVFALIELPDTSSPASMERTIQMSEIPEKITKCALYIRNGVEG